MMYGALLPGQVGSFGLKRQTPAGKDPIRTGLESVVKFALVRGGQARMRSLVVEAQGCASLPIPLQAACRRSVLMCFRELFLFGTASAPIDDSKLKAMSKGREGGILGYETDLKALHKIRMAAAVSLSTVR
jgi:hypothetical protein